MASGQQDQSVQRGCDGGIWMGFVVLKVLSRRHFRILWALICQEWRVRVEASRMPPKEGSVFSTSRQVKIIREMNEISFQV